MKTRIKEVIDSNGRSIYTVQKWFLVWWDWERFMHLDQAKDYANYEHNTKTVIHSIEKTI